MESVESGMYSIVSQEYDGASVMSEHCARAEDVRLFLMHGSVIYSYQICFPGEKQRNYIGVNSSACIYTVLKNEIVCRFLLFYVSKKRFGMLHKLRVLFRFMFRCSNTGRTNIIYDFYLCVSSECI